MTLVEQKLLKRAKELDPKFEQEEILEINRDYAPVASKEEGGEGKVSTNVIIQPNLKLIKEEPQSNR